jgi:hypothetical protein
MGLMSCITTSGQETLLMLIETGGEVEDPVMAEERRSQEAASGRLYFIS